MSAGNDTVGVLVTPLQNTPIGAGNVSMAMISLLAPLFATLIAGAFRGRALTEKNLWGLLVALVLGGILSSGLSVAHYNGDLDWNNNVPALNVIFWDWLGFGLEVGCVLFVNGVLIGSAAGDVDISKYDSFSYVGIARGMIMGVGMFTAFVLTFFGFYNLQATGDPVINLGTAFAIGLAIGLMLLYVGGRHLKWWYSNEQDWVGNLSHVLITLSNVGVFVFFAWTVSGIFLGPVINATYDPTYIFEVSKFTMALQAILCWSVLTSLIAVVVIIFRMDTSGLNTSKDPWFMFTATRGYNPISNEGVAMDTIEGGRSTRKL